MVGGRVTFRQRDIDAFVPKVLAFGSRRIADRRQESDINALLAKGHELVH